jgi:hypothetical protein
MRIAKRTFSRVSPVDFFENGGAPMGWIVVRHSHVGTILERRRTHGRWVKVTSAKGKIFRVLRYSVNLPANEIVMDWAGWIDLQGRKDEESDTLALTIVTARWWHFFIIPFRHVDPAYRLSAWLAALSVILGIVSIGASRPWEMIWPHSQMVPETRVLIQFAPMVAQEQQEPMTKAEAKPRITRLFHEWASIKGKRVPYDSPDGGLTFFYWLQSDHPEVLSFRSSADKWQVVHGWLLQAHLVMR